MAVRKFALVTLNSTDEVVERYDLSKVTDPSGFGFQLNMSTLDTEVESYITKIAQAKRKIQLKVYHENGYEECDTFYAWLTKHISDTTALEWTTPRNNGTEVKRYCEGRIVDTSFSELNSFGVLEDTVQFQQTTPFFEIKRNDASLTVKNGKTYPYSYPYSYGTTTEVDNEILNNYIADTPLIIEILGPAISPSVMLTDENGTTYNIVSFNKVTLAEGQSIIINSAKKKIYLKEIIDGACVYTDFYSKISEAGDSYLRALPNKTSKITMNVTASSNTATLVAHRRQYLL